MASRGKDLSVDQKKTIVHMKSEGHSGCKIAKVLGISRSTVAKVLKRYEQTGSLENKRVDSGCGRRRKIYGGRSLRTLSRIVLGDRRKTLRDITAEFNTAIGADCSCRTVQRTLHSLGFKRRVVRKKVVVKEVNRKLRKKWCLARLHWTVNNQWKTILFSDEMMIDLKNTGKVTLWRKASERWRPECIGIVQDPPCSRLKIMVWGCVSYYGVGDLAFVEGTMNSGKYIQVLEEHLQPSVHRLFGERRYCLQEDNASVHKSRETEQWKRQHAIPILPWPAQSPDLSPIENVWSVLKSKVKNRMHRIGTLADLKREITTAWNEVPVWYLQKLFSSLPRRLRLVMSQKGHLTRY